MTRKEREEDPMEAAAFSAQREWISNDDALIRAARDGDLASFEKFLGMLNDCDDVQEVYHNVVLGD